MLSHLNATRAFSKGLKIPEEAEQFDAAAYFAGYGPASRAINASAISAAHADPPIVPNPVMPAGNPYAVPSVLARPGRRLFVGTWRFSEHNSLLTRDHEVHPGFTYVKSCPPFTLMNLLHTHTRFAHA
jgi:hypothetical protein